MTAADEIVPALPADDSMPSALQLGTAPLDHVPAQHGAAAFDGGPLTTVRPDAQRGGHALWITFAAFSGWLAGPLAAAAYSLALGDGNRHHRLGFSPSASLPAFAALAAVWFGYSRFTASTLHVSRLGGFGRATLVLSAGSAGWISLFFFSPHVASIRALVLAWLVLTVPYPCIASLVVRRRIIALNQ